jgi:2-dehydro-3-deoxyphosphogluconate aldolase/(4S)-4-hydroxy-2-oxoglutarate aldolase
MKTKEQILSAIVESKVVAIIRLKQPGNVLDIAKALYAGGVTAVEVTMGTPNALGEIENMAAHDGFMPGAGSVIDAKTAEQAITRGADFLVTPVSKPDIIATAHQYDKPVFSGAFTPKEMLQAYEWGADIVKLFPADALGMNYFNAVQAPLPQIPIMPTGGVNFENAAQWIRIGAKCLGVGSTLVNLSNDNKINYDQITQRANKLVKIVKDA